MSGEAASPLKPQTFMLGTGASTPTARYHGLDLDSEALVEELPAKEAEPHTATAIHLSPSVSGLSGGLKLPSEASSTSLQSDHPLYQSPTRKNLRRHSPSDWIERRHEELVQHPKDLPNPGDTPPRLPKHDDFPNALRVQIIPKYPRRTVDIRHVVVLLHQLGRLDSSLTQLAWDLYEEQQETCFVLLQAREGVPTPDSRYDRAEASGQWDELAFKSASSLSDMIKRTLITKCGFVPRSILLMGHGQGGMAVLTTAALWAGIEFGGVVSIGGPLPYYLRSASAGLITTPALVVRSSAADSNQFAFDCMERRFACVDTYVFSGTHDTLPNTPEFMKALVEFLAHRLQRSEWTKQAVISFDGGGIRGYGSLLILQQLMNKIGDEEKRLDILEGKATRTTSSFAPWPYRPIGHGKQRSSSNSSAKPTNASGSDTVARDIEELPNSSLFLPCHYFDYAVGTSTGGLISIMLSRLRMTVDDCINEYKTLGQKIFGNPRPLAFGAVMWHKFNYRVLEDVIKNVTRRHSEKSEEDVLHFPSDEDLCRTIVIAYAEYNKTEAPYLFRTYYTPRPASEPNRTRLRQATARNHGQPPRLSIWQIGRATSAAPKYFPPIKIERSIGDDHQREVRFKDGGFGCNNPSEEAYHDIVHKHGGSSAAVSLFISIGTGVSPVELFAKAPGNVANAWANLKAAKKHPSRTLHVHDAMARLARRDDKDIFDYYRFDGGSRLGQVELDEWKSHRLTRLTGRSTEPGFKTLDKMYVATAAYLQQGFVQKGLDECAKLLVKRRRYRTRDASAWDRYASASFYECSYQKCQKTPRKTAQQYKDHVKKEHFSALAEQPLEKAMKTSRRCWVYRNPPSTPGPKTTETRLERKGDPAAPISRLRRGESSDSGASGTESEEPPPPAVRFER
ncbi:MAG: hypothetical protein Q9172_001670 [Xanthocarpia lactea]